MPADAPPTRIAPAVTRPVAHRPLSPDAARALVVGADAARVRGVLLAVGALIALVVGVGVGTTAAHEHGMEVLLAGGIAVAALVPIVVRAWTGRFDPFEPLVTVAGVYVVYFVVGPLLRLLTGDTVIIGRDMRALYAPAFAAVLVGVGAMWLGYHVPLGGIVGRQLTRARGSERSSPAALRRLRRIGWGLTVAAMAALVLWSRLEGQSLARFFLPGVIAPAEKTGGGTNLAYLFLAIEWFIPAFLILSVSGGFRARPVQWAYFAFVSIAYTSLGFRYRLVILWAATFILAYLRRGRRPLASTLLVGGGAFLLFAGWLGIARAVFKSSARHATAAPTFVEVARNSLSDTEVFETFGAVLDAVPGRVEFAGADPYVYVFVQPIPRALWPGKPLPTFLEKIGHAIGTRAAGSAGAAVPHFGEYYLAFGWPGLVLGMAAFGAAVRALWAWYLADARNAWRQVVFAVSNGFLVQVIIRGYSPQIVQEWFFIIGPAVLGMWLAHRGERPAYAGAAFAGSAFGAGPRFVPAFGLTPAGVAPTVAPNAAAPDDEVREPPRRALPALPPYRPADVPALPAGGAER